MGLHARHNSMQRRAYYDAEPRYQREKTQDWYQQKEKTNQGMREVLTEYLTPRHSVLEVACGGGWLSEFILKAGVKSYSGFDFSETAVTNARKRLAAFEEAKMWRGDALAAQYYSKKYDSIVSHQFLQCLIGPDRVKWLAHCRSALKPEGVLIFSSAIGIPPSLAASIDPVTKQNKLGNRYYATEEEIKAEILKAGLELEEVIHPEEFSGIFVAGASIA